MESRFSSLSLSETTHQSLQNSGSKSSPSSVSRLWRPAAQRNMKNQWSRLNSLRQEWVSASSTARSHATSLVNAYLSQRYMKDMELGVLKDMADIQKKASWKLLKQQVLHHDKLVSSYKAMGSISQFSFNHVDQAHNNAYHRDQIRNFFKVTTVVNMVNTSQSLRCFLKGGTSSPLIQFSSISEDTDDNGDGGGIPVFTFWSISTFEKLAWELIEMFKLELYLKRLLVIEFLSLRSTEDPIIKRLCWLDEIYEGEFGNLSRCNLDHEQDSESTHMQANCQPDSDVLQVYLTAWLTDVNIDKLRVEDIFSEVGEEMHVNYVS